MTSPSTTPPSATPRPAEDRARMLPVKVCGITRLEDGLAALESGAAALGFICYAGSPRYIAPPQAAKIIRDLPDWAVKVGVFVGAEAEEINETARVCRLDWVQLHGGEPAELMDQLERPSYRAFRLKEEADVANVELAPDALVLLDTFDPDHYGGTGRPFNWDWAHRLAGQRKTILAGGLTPENAARAVAAVRPTALDISSGVETAPGIKDAAKIAAFFNALREAGYSGPPPWRVDHASGTEV